MKHVNEASGNAGLTETALKPFIRNDQFNFIKDQTRILVTGQATSNDASVLTVYRHLAQEKVLGLFPDLTAEQKAVLEPVREVKDTADAEAYLEGLQPYLVPFRTLTQQSLKKLFPKAKKLKGPDLSSIDFRQLSYLAWLEQSSHLYLVAEKDGKLVGLSGSFTPSSKKGICTICHRHGEVGLFTAKTKGANQDTFIKRGNTICQDNETCNSQVNTLERLYGFIERLKK